MDPERPIEKLLRAFARKRREDAGAPLELHPATRRMLQGEVGRQHPKPAAGGLTFPQLLASWWPRLAWAVPMVVVLGGVMWLLVPRQVKPGPTAELAKNVSAPASPATDEVKRREAAAAPANRQTALQQTASPMLAAADTDRRKAEDKAAVPNAANQNLQAETSTETAAAKAGRLAVAAAAPLQIATAEKDARLDTTSTGGVMTAYSGVTEAGSSRLTINGAQTNFGVASATAAGAQAAGAQIQTTNQSASLMIAGTEAPMPLGAAGGGFGGGGGGGGGGAGGGGRGGGRGGGGGGRGGRGGAGGRDPGSGLALGGASPAAPSGAPRAESGPTPPLALNRAGSSTASPGQAQTLAPASEQPSLPGRFRNTASSVEPNQILAAFRVEQIGSQLRVIDNDGSIYTGEVAVAAAGNAYRAATEQKGAERLKSDGGAAVRSFSATPAAKAQVAQHYSFRVTGTNRTRNEPVVFTGNFVVLTNAPAAAPTSGVRAGALSPDQAKAPPLPLPQNSIIITGSFVVLTGAPAAAPPSGARAGALSPAQTKAPPLPLLQNSTITGRAQVGTSREFEINAVPAAP